MWQFKNMNRCFSVLSIKKLLVLLFILIQINTIAQKKHEIGVFVGSSYYMGELNSTKLFYMPSPAIGFLYRYDLNARYAFKLTGTFAKLQANDSKSDDLYQQQRNHSFSTLVSDISPMIEFNFLPFHAASRHEYYAAYVTAGLGVMFMQSPSNFPLHPVIPFGLGFKYGVSKRMVIAAEWTYRKTFTDYIDQVPPDEYPNNGGAPAKQLSYNNTKDWYSFAGITFTYKFALGRNSCPAYGQQ